MYGYQSWLDQDDHDSDRRYRSQSGNTGYGRKSYAGNADRGNRSLAGNTGNRGRFSTGKADRGNSSLAGNRDRFSPGNADRGDSSDDGECPQEESTSKSGRSACYTVISPDERRRRKMTEIADREARQYEEYKRNQTPRRFSYVGTCGQGQVWPKDEFTARQQQIRIHAQSKTSRILKEQERKQQQRQMEDRELQQKKAAARRKAEQNERREEERQHDLRSDMDQRMAVFLNRLEFQRAGSQPQQPSRSQSMRSNHAGYGMYNY
ncbi:epithelial-stromal interaction protein 1-like isoform X1 [Littorina saxatilis]|uniref:Uncharacterized protein n=1 Tax=Littorina saxatilis TaxID=31220 RepID=A0AAN9FZS3_9CAEN